MDKGLRMQDCSAVMSVIRFFQRHVLGRPRVQAWSLTATLTGSMDSLHRNEQVFIEGPFRQERDAS